MGWVASNRDNTYLLTYFVLYLVAQHLGFSQEIGRRGEGREEVSKVHKELEGWGGKGGGESDKNETGGSINGKERN